MNKKLGIIIGVVVALLLLGGGGYMLLGSKTGPTPTPEVTNNSQEVGTLKPEDIGLKLTLLSGGKQVQVSVDKASDIKEMEYEITYDADVPAAERVEGAEEKVTRGFSEEVELESGQTSYKSKAFDLGSASKNVVRYDTGVTEVKILMKVTKQDGSLYQVEDSVEL